MEWFMDVLRLVLDTAEVDHGPVIDRIVERHSGMRSGAPNYPLLQLCNVLADHLNMMREKGVRVGGIRRD